MEPGALSPEQFLSYFEVSAPYTGVYVLGPFARYVTLYSQQVRALNLIGALLEAKRIRSGDPLAVIGAGAAGLTAASAAALAGVKVTLIDELESPLEFQANNRQRWLHPHIYDWPKPDSSGDRARLPILDWTADYAASVAAQIRPEWERIKSHTGLIFEPLTRVELLPGGGRADVVGNNGRYLRNVPVILAVGFGLEPEGVARGSYWAEDDLDNNLRRAGERKWLVAGFGDGALTDIIRVCLRDFRHAEIRKFFQGHPALQEITTNLLELHKEKDPKKHHDCFRELELRGLEERLRPFIRQNRPKVYLTGPDENFLAPRSSVLNRLILLSLIRLQAVEHVLGPLDPSKTEMTGPKISVSRRGTTETYDRVICRFGPDPNALKQGFLTVYEQCGQLRQRWADLNQFQDPTRLRNRWDYLDDKLPRLVTKPPQRPFEEEPEVRKLEIYAASMIVSQEIRNDGSSTVTYEVNDLSLQSGQIEGLWVRSVFTAGNLGVPEPNGLARQHGMKWQSDEPDLSSSLQEARDRARTVSGVLRFAKPLHRDSPPVSFGWTVTVLNGDALSTWEFEQIYDPANRKHVNSDPIDNLESFTVMVWFPVETLHLRLTLPERITSEPYVSAFAFEKRESLERADIAPDDVLRLIVVPGSDKDFSPKRWPRSESLQKKATRTNLGNRTWELTVERPPVGSIFSLDFDLPTHPQSGNAAAIVDDARLFRDAMLKYSTDLREGSPPTAVHEHMNRLYSFIESRFALRNTEEIFGVTWLTYNDAARKLVIVDGLENGRKLNASAWDFWLKFGVGVAGACFKNAGEPIVYVRPGADAIRTGPDIYVPPVNGKPHEVLVAIPIDHPRYKAGMQVERSRQCAGVVSIGSDHPSTRLKELVGKKDEFKKLMAICQYFGNSVYDILMRGRV